VLVRPQRAGRVFEQLGFELLPAEPGAFVFANDLIEKSRRQVGLASAAVPPELACCPKAVGETARATAAAALIRNIGLNTFPFFTLLEA
jgi:hypothetical protein